MNMFREVQVIIYDAKSTAFIVSQDDHLPRNSSNAVYYFYFFFLSRGNPDPELQLALAVRRVYMSVVFIGSKT